MMRLPSRRRMRRAAACVLLLCGLLRLRHLGASLTGDEAYMLRAYVDRPFATIATTYDAPNNHVLLSLILRAIDRANPSRLVLSLASPVPMQLVSAAASIACLPLAYSLGALLIGPVASALAAAALGVSFWHLLYSHLLRGYALSSLLVLLQAWLLAQALFAGRRRLLWALPFAIAAAAYVVPVNAFFTAGLGVWAALLAWRRGERALLRAVAAAGAAGAAATLLLYRPVLAQLRAQAGPLPDPFWTLLVRRAVEQLGAFGGSAWTAAAWCALGAFGLWALARRGARRRAAAGLVAAVLVAPFALATLARNAPPSRVFVAALPIYALAAGFALRELLAGRRRAGGAGALAAAGLIVGAAAALADTVRFVRYNAGLEVRGAVLKVRELARELDDFVAIAAPLGEDQTAGALNWDYYAIAAKLEAYETLAPDQALPYLRRSHYFVLAVSTEAARAAARRSRLDEALIERLTVVANAGRIAIHRADVDDEMLARYRRAADAPVPDLDALTALGTRACRDGALQECVDRLYRARLLAPEDPRARYLFGHALYLAFKDEPAVQELEWVVARDTTNAHAPYYLADALASLGRREEALRWYGWYFGSSPPAAAWLLKPRARLGAAAVSRGERRARFEGRTAGDFDRLAKRYEACGSYERARIALVNAFNRERVGERWIELARLTALLGRNFEALKMLERAIREGRTDRNTQRQLARQLAVKGDLPSARAILRKIVAEHPDYDQARKLLQEIDRLR